MMLRVALFLLTVPAIGVPALADCDPATNAEAVAEVRQAVEAYRRSLDAVKVLGVPVGPIETYLRVLASAAEKGVDLAEAAGEVDAEMLKISANNERLCDLAYPDDDSRWVCYAKFARTWQARNVRAVLSWNDPGSVVRRAVRKWMGSKCDRTAPSAAGGIRIDITPKGQRRDDLNRDDVLRLLRKPGS